MPEIRDALISDAERILEIYAWYVQNTAITFEYDVPSVQEFRERMIHTMQKYPYLVILDHGRIEGYAYAGPLKERAAYDWCCEMSIYLDHDTRHNGLGRKLYEAMEVRLKAMGICNLYACIGYPEKEDQYLTRNSAEFHEHLGYHLCGTFHDSGYKFDTWYDMIWMEKIIAQHHHGMKNIIPYPEIRDSFTSDSI